MGKLAQMKYVEMAWGIEVYYRELKQESATRSERRCRRAGATQPHRHGVRVFGLVARYPYGNGLGERKARRLQGAMRMHLAHPRFTISSAQVLFMLHRVASLLHS